MKKILLIIVILILFMIGCVSISEVVPAGIDTYRLSGTDRRMGISGESIKTKLFEHASNYCILQNKIFIPETSSSQNYRPFIGLAHAELTFQCK